MAKRFVSAPVAWQLSSAGAISWPVGRKYPQPESGWLLRHLAGYVWPGYKQCSWRRRKLSGIIWLIKSMKIRRNIENEETLMSVISSESNRHRNNGEEGEEEYRIEEIEKPR